MKNKPRIVSVLLARGGSKGIPRKNIIPLGGKPLIQYTIDASIHGGADETWVSTDSDEIAEVSERLGAKILKRPAELAGDTASSESALLHFAENVDFDWLIFIQPTSPLLLPDDIKKGITKMKEGKYDSVFSAYEEHWMATWDEKGQPRGWDIFHRPRRQDAEPVFRENGAFYITKKEHLLKSRLRYSGIIGIVEMPFYRSFQIDTQEDLAFVEKII
ncbi:MAG: N-acetylneuraminate cytidylyltransferase [Parcubacteria group bacterium GW2011_GWA2_49_9]|nr:MAG: N-acetylneuraminate cytidylyltransferase [Parcubacteria group bacterium GW2011_GWA2_49_9]